MYGVGGEPDLPEAELSHLEGYRASAPVRIGNGAATQRQIDTYGEVADALWMMRLRSDEPMNPHRWRLMRALANRTLREWREPDEGIWEVRGEPAHFVLSEGHVLGRAGPRDRARRAGRLRRREPRAVARRARRAARGDPRSRLRRASSARSPSPTARGTLDASNLMLAQVGFIDPDDARFVGTVRAIQEHLTRGGLVDRYGSGSADDGLAGGTRARSPSARSGCARADADRRPRRRAGAVRPGGRLRERPRPDGARSSRRTASSSATSRRRTPTSP